MIGILYTIPVLGC